MIGANERCWLCKNPDPIWICTTCEARYCYDCGNGSKCNACFQREGQQPVQHRETTSEKSLLLTGALACVVVLVLSMLFAPLRRFLLLIIGLPLLLFAAIAVHQGFWWLVNRLFDESQQRIR